MVIDLTGFRLLELPVLVTECVLSTMHPIEIPGFHYVSEAQKIETNQTQIQSLKIIRELFDDSTCILNSKLTNVVFAIDSFSSTDNKKTIDWLKSRSSGTMALACIEGENVEEDLNYFFQEIKVTKALAIHASGLKSLPPGISRNLEYLEILHGQWITLDILLTLDFAKLQIQNLALTNQEWNIFFKKWMNSECNFKLKSVKAQLNEEGVLENILEGIDFTYINSPQEFLKPEENVVVLHSGVKIVRNDGVVASIFQLLIQGSLAILMEVHYDQ
ncbi:hypothetical protein B9Z55_005670 [Caenorhabditis nigoni]|uniref:Sdz-33 F-box domain-containing protein n=1 Tax=Caenorhabditis nigoni TaxID=1611254 RepID=A0A2G5V2N6_9PELO|nr:hypothetical protein B9Z55_005670 [Caenorhabditis nigoni]